MADDKNSASRFAANRAGAQSAKQAAVGKRANLQASKEFLRPENEDDDGYDPYSDRKPVESMWEEDPWR